MENKKIKFVDNYTGKEVETELPNSSKYDFLYERNKDYMNEIALTFDKRRITYEELHQRIDEYTRALYSNGIRQGDVIGVCVVNTPESVYLLYALDRIGATVVGLSPLNNEYKMQRDIEMVRPQKIISVDMFYDKFKNSCEALNITPILYSPLESVSNPIVKLGYSAMQLKKGNKLFGLDHNLKSIVKNGKYVDAKLGEFDPTQVTDIMFTGGSSGVHKGVDLNGNGLNSVVKALDNVLILEPGMTHLGNIPFGHMVFGRLVLHYALCKNLQFALTLNALPNKFYDELARTKAHGAMGGPIHWESLIGNPNIKPGSLSELIQPLSGGEMFKPEKRKQAEEALRIGGSSAYIGDGLGLTEMWAPTHVNMGGKNTPGTVGFAIPFVESKVVDPKIFESFNPNAKYNLEELPVGEVGLLIVSGPGMMLGYHDNINETNKVFINDENGKRWYSTGDLVIRCGINNNEFKFAGRKKRNFVSGVDNIYPEQIEALLLRFPEIREVAVTKIPDDKYQYLPKYHISLIDENCNVEILKNKIDVLIEGTLGSSALAGYIEYTYTPLPRTDNGKINATILEQQDLELYKKNEGLTLVRKGY
ncbi:MAG: acyl--CoA ligase [Firmicutes bacterium]|nr:acyl--CoA ligase [Bacillota bacterium]